MIEKIPTDLFDTQFGKLCTIQRNIDDGLEKSDVGYLECTPHRGFKGWPTKDDFDNFIGLKMTAARIVSLRKSLREQLEATKTMVYELKCLEEDFNKYADDLNKTIEEARHA